MKKILLILIMVVTFVCPALAQTEDHFVQPENLEYASGKVLKVVSENQNEILSQNFGTKQTVQNVQIKILSGKQKGKIIYTENQLTSNPAYDIKVAPNTRVILDIEKQGSVYNYYIADKERLPMLLALGVVFLLLMFFIGGKKGLTSLLSLGVTALLVFFVMVPAIIHNQPPLPVTIGISVVSTVFAMFLVGGLNLKSLSATLGTILGVAVAGLISLIAIKFAPLSGFHDQESIILWTSRPDLNLTGILASGMIIGSLGAIMDIGMTIASCIAEMKEHNPDAGIKMLFNSGMNVGKDIMGTMANTLILAYVGSAFPLILLAVNAPLIKLINLNSIAAEITAALSGSIGIILCVPMTAIITAYLMTKFAKKGSSEA